MSSLCPHFSPPSSGSSVELTRAKSLEYKQQELRGGGGFDVWPVCGGGVRDGEGMRGDKLCLPKSESLHLSSQYESLPGRAEGRKAFEASESFYNRRNVLL